MRLRLRHAADLVEASYRLGPQPIIRSRLVQSVDEQDVQAHLLDNGVLLIPGSNSVDDYLRYNLRIDIGGRRYRLEDRNTGNAIGSRWHEGFLAHALVIRDRLGQRRPRFIIGHSLGAASAQFLSLLWRVPAIGFAAPRLHAGDQLPDNQARCLCLWRHDDPVGTFPNRFHHVGTSVRLEGRTTGLLNHSMRHYKASMTHPGNRGRFPEMWPRGR